MTSVLFSLNQGLHEAMEANERVILLGEDIIDPYGGAFKVTKGLSSQFPEQVYTTPISEQSIVGIATGLALRGFRPVVEIMFGDFITLAMDQLVNHAAKFRWMYNDKVKVPIVIRTPMGGRRGYGPTHSQSLEKIFLGIPGLRVVAPNSLSNPGELIKNAIADDDPVLFIEHKLLYTAELLEENSGDLVDAKVSHSDHTFPSYNIKYSSKPDVTIATYGYNFEIVRNVALEVLYENEIFVEIVLFTQLTPFYLDSLYDSVVRTKKLITFEEGSITAGWGGELTSRVCEKFTSDIKFIRIGAKDLPIANSRTLEDSILPSKQQLKQKIIQITTMN